MMFENSPLMKQAEFASVVETQFNVIKRYICQFQQTLDAEHDVALLLTDFGQSVLMEVTEIRCEPPHLMIFRGLVNGTEATLIQHDSRLNFLIKAVRKDRNAEHRKIGFSVVPEEQSPTSP